MPPDTHDRTGPVDPPALAASVVGAVRTERARLDEIRQRAEAATTSPERSHIWQDARDVPALLALVDELTAQRDLARDAAVALEQETARLQNEREAAVTTLKAEAREQMEGAARRDRSWPDSPDVQRLTADAALRARAYRHAAEIVSPAAVLGLGLQPETSEQ